MDKQKEQWTEQDSQKFIRYGDFFVPYRQLQADIMCQLMEETPDLQNVADVCCGAGFLGKNVLEKFTDCHVHAYDLSDEMLAEAKENLKHFSERFTTHTFDLKETAWRKSLPAVDAFVSSLAIHHLNGDEKEQLYHDLYASLNPGGVLLVADIIQPTTQIAFQVAATLWDQFVKKAAEEAGHPEAYQEFVDKKWNYFEHPDADTIDQPSALSDHLKWLEKAGFRRVDVFWMTAGHAIFGGWKAP